MKDLTLTEAMRLFMAVFPDEKFFSIRVEIINSNYTMGRPKWQVYTDKLGLSEEMCSLEEAIECLRIISNTPNRHKDIIVK